MLTLLQRLLFARTSLESQLYPAVSKKVTFRPYRPDDYDACLAIYVKNEAGRFPNGYRQKFEQYLRKDRKNFIIAERESRIAGYGGLTLVAPNVAILCFGIVAPEFQRQRIGSTLTALRVALLEPQESGAFAVICAVNSSMPIYRRFGFVEASHWKSEDGAKHPVGFLRLPILLLNRLKLTLHRRGQCVRGGLVLHTSDEFSCELQNLSGDRYQVNIARIAK